MSRSIGATIPLTIMGPSTPRPQRPPHIRFLRALYRHGNMRSGRHPIPAPVQRDRTWPGCRRGKPDRFAVHRRQWRRRPGVCQHGRRNAASLITSPYCLRSISSQTVAAIYGSVSGSYSSVMLAANVTQPAFFSLGDANDTFVGGGGPDNVPAAAATT